MSKKNKLSSPRTGAEKRAAPRRNLTATAVLLAILAAAAALGIWLSQSRPVASPVATNAADNSQPAVPAAGRKYHALVGRWLRPDGGYVLEIKNVDDSGLMDAAYFNPGPIHVSKAAALRDGGVTKVYVELNDINYPGSSYTLAYDSASDALQGIYFQAVERQNFDVAFQRMK